MGLRITFLGVGEALDEHYPTTSLLVEFGGPPHLLMLECGFTAPPELFRRARAPEHLDALWVSHFHGDHFLGIPALLVRYHEARRKNPLLVLGQRGIRDTVEAAMNLAYPGFLPKIPFALEYRELEPGAPFTLFGATLSTAENGHGSRTLALRIDDGPASLFYSGDGRPTAETLALASGASLIVHEAFKLDAADVPGHGTIAACIAFAHETRARALAVVHMHRAERARRRGEILAALAAARGLHAFLPEPGDVVDLP